MWSFDRSACYVRPGQRGSSLVGKEWTARFGTMAPCFWKVVLCSEGMSSGCQKATSSRASELTIL